jgi:hypothetical protein
MEENVDLHRLGTGPALRHSLATTNGLESIFSLMEQRTGKVDRWRTSNQRHRGFAAALLDVETAAPSRARLPSTTRFTRRGPTKLSQSQEGRSGVMKPRCCSAAFSTNPGTPSSPALGANKSRPKGGDIFTEQLG